MQPAEAKIKEMMGEIADTAGLPQDSADTIRGTALLVTDKNRDSLDSAQTAAWKDALAESWRQTQITDAQAKLIFYSAFVDGKLDAPKSLLPEVTACTSGRSTQSSHRGTCGACRTSSPAPSRSLIRFRSSRRRPSSEPFSHRVLATSLLSNSKARLGVQSGYETRVQKNPPEPGRGNGHQMLTQGRSGFEPSHKASGGN